MFTRNIFIGALTPNQQTFRLWILFSFVRKKTKKDPNAMGWFGYGASALSSSCVSGVAYYHPSHHRIASSSCGGGLEHATSDCACAMRRRQQSTTQTKRQETHIAETKRRNTTAQREELKTNEIQCQPHHHDIVWLAWSGWHKGKGDRSESFVGRYATPSTTATRHTVFRFLSLSAIIVVATRSSCRVRTSESQSVATWCVRLLLGWDGLVDGAATGSEITTPFYEQEPSEAELRDCCVRNAPEKGNK